MVKLGSGMQKTRDVATSGKGWRSHTAKGCDSKSCGLLSNDTHPARRRSWSLGRPRTGGGNQPGDTLCFVSPDRYAVSSLTYAKRITRLIV